MFIRRRISFLTSVFVLLILTLAVSCSEKTEEQTLPEGVTVTFDTAVATYKGLTPLAKEIGLEEGSITMKQLEVWLNLNGVDGEAYLEKRYERLPQKPGDKIGQTFREGVDAWLATQLVAATAELDDAFDKTAAMKEWEQSKEDILRSLHFADTYEADFVSDVTDDDIAAYYEEHKEEWLRKELVQARFIVLSIDSKGAAMDLKAEIEDLKNTEPQQKVIEKQPDNTLVFVALVIGTIGILTGLIALVMVRSKINPIDDDRDMLASEGYEKVEERPRAIPRAKAKKKDDEELDDVIRKLKD